VLQKSSSLVGRVLLPAGADHRDYGYSVERLEENDSGRIATGGGDVEKDGNFRWEDCEAGTYSVTVRSARENEFAPLRLGGIEVRKGQTVDLGVIDLRNAWRPVTVRVVAPDGELVAGCFTFGAHGSDLLGAMRTIVWPREFSEGSVTIPRKDEEDLDLAITVPGLRTKVFHDVHDGDVLRMEPAFRVRIALSKKVSQPPEGQRLLLGLFPEDADQRAIVLKGPRWPTVAFDARGEVELLVPTPGRHRLRWILERGAGMDTETRYWQEPPQVIEVAEQPESQRIEVVCPIDPATAWKEDG
jgi:hypothetical protein